MKEAIHSKRAQNKGEPPYEKKLVQIKRNISLKNSKIVMIGIKEKPTNQRKFQMSRRRSSGLPI